MHELTRMRSAPLASLVALAAALVVALVAASTASADEQHGHPGAVFVQTNDVHANAIVAYARSADGALTPAGRYRTHGRGGTEVQPPTDPLSSQGSLAYDRRHRLLYAVNAGSDTVSVFAVRGTKLRLVQVVRSRGSFPTSVAIHDSLVYVLNAGSEGSVSGYRTDGKHLTRIRGSVRSLGLGNATPPAFRTSPGQIGITHDGAHLLVSTKGHGFVDVFALGRHGRPTSTAVRTATGPFPFAFAFDARGRVVLVDPSGTANSYRVSRSGALIATGTQAPNGQMATCWIARARGYFYAANTASDTITGYAESPHGQLRLLRADGVSAATDTGPIDITAAPDGLHVFELNGLAGDLGIYAVARDGTLTRTGTVHGLPAFNGSNGMEGIVAT